MTLSLNDRALALADRLAADAEALQVQVTTLANGARVIDCGAGGFEAGRSFAEICMGGLGNVAYAPLVIEGRWLPALTVTTDRPAVACLAAQYAGWRVDRDGYFAMGSGPARALIRAEELYDDLDWDERASAAVLCLETREPPPAAVADFVAERAGVPPSALTLLMAPTACIDRQRADRGARRRDRAAQAPRARLRRAEGRRGATAAARCRRWPATTWRRSGAPTTPCSTAARSTSRSRPTTTILRELVERLPATASSDYGEPFGKVFKDAEYDFYTIDPLLFSPAQVRLTSVASGRSFEAGRVNLEVLERSFWG